MADGSCRNPTTQCSYGEEPSVKGLGGIPVISTIAAAAAKGSNVCVCVRGTFRIK